MVAGVDLFGWIICFGFVGVWMCGGVDVWLLVMVVGGVFVS